MQHRSQARSVGFDELPVPQSTPETLDAVLAARFVRDPRDPAAHRKLHLLAADKDGMPRLSVAHEHFRPQAALAHGKLRSLIAWRCLKRSSMPWHTGTIPSVAAISAYTFFTDRLELYSPGALADTLTVDALEARQ